MRVSENEKLRKTKQNLIIKDFKIRELMDETGEVEQLTYIQISFEGILINLSVPAAMKLGIALRKDLNIN
jgi:hypothetical protein